jgi:hypothetical protein
MFIEMVGLLKSWVMDPVNSYQIIKKRWND